MVAELSVGAIREIRVNGTNCVEFPVVQVSCSYLTRVISRETR